MDSVSVVFPESAQGNPGQHCQFANDIDGVPMWATRAMFRSFEASCWTVVAYCLTDRRKVGRWWMLRAMHLEENMGGTIFRKRTRSISGSTRVNSRGQSSSIVFGQQRSCLSPSIPSTMSSDNLPETVGLRAKMNSNPLETNPVTNIPHGNIPNTPLASATIAFLLGGTCMFGLYTALSDISATAHWLTYQLGFFVAAWSFFHWAEFATTAGWNFEKCSVDCEWPKLYILHQHRL